MKQYIFRISKQDEEKILTKLKKETHICNSKICFNKSLEYKANAQLEFNFNYSNQLLTFEDKVIDYKCANVIECQQLTNFKAIYISNNLYLIATSKNCQCNFSKIGIDLNSEEFITTSLNSQYCLVKTKKYIEKLQVKNKLLMQETNVEKSLKLKKHIKKTKVKIVNTLKYELNVIANDLLFNYDVIYMENLGLTKKQKFNYKINNYVFSLFKSILVSKAHIFKRQVKFVSADFPSSQICSNCGHINSICIQEKNYECQNCQSCINRDLNAAVNIYNKGESSE